MIEEEKIKMIAQQLLPSFIPKDAKIGQLTFNFTVPPTANCEVKFERDKDGKWLFLSGKTV